MALEDVEPVETWRTTHGDLTDKEWDLISQFSITWAQPGKLGRPPKHAKRDIVNAILYVSATGCQWRALPKTYPHWNTVHRYHVQWSKDGTWEQVAQHLAGLARQLEGRHINPSAGSIDARTVRGAPTVTSPTRGYDAGKKISGRKVFGIVDTLGTLISVVVLPASTSDNTGGIKAVDAAGTRLRRMTKLWSDAGFKVAFAQHCRSLGITTEVIKRVSENTFVPLPKRWVIERTWSWLMNNRRLQIDYERLPEVTQGFIWTTQTRTLLRQLTAN